MAFVKKVERPPGLGYLSDERIRPRNRFEQAACSLEILVDSLVTQARAKRGALPLLTESVSLDAPPPWMNYKKPPPTRQTGANVQTINVNAMVESVTVNQYRNLGCCIRVRFFGGRQFRFSVDGPINAIHFITGVGGIKHNLGRMSDFCEALAQSTIPKIQIGGNRRSKTVTFLLANGGSYVVEVDSHLLGNVKLIEP